MFVGDIAQAQVLRIDAQRFEISGHFARDYIRDLGDQPLDQLRRRHFETENGDALVLLNRRMVGDGEGETGLTRPRASRHDDEVALLQTTQDFVKVGKPALHAEGFVLMLTQIVNAVDPFVHCRG